MEVVVAARSCPNNDDALVDTLHYYLTPFSHRKVRSVASCQGLHIKPAVYREAERRAVSSVTAKQPKRQSERRGQQTGPTTTAANSRWNITRQAYS